MSRSNRALLNRHPALEAHIAAASALDEGRFSGIRRHYGSGAAAEVFFQDHGSYDFIVSRAVLEHVYDPLLAIRDMASALNPGGMLLHKVDLRDHGMFSRYGHELRFLEVSDWLYRRMTRHSGRPNRVLIDQYRAALRESGLEFRILVTRLAGAGDITPHLVYEAIPGELRRKSIKYVRTVRKRFAKAVRGLTDADLSVVGIFIVARDLRS